MRDSDMSETTLKPSLAPHAAELAQAQQVKLHFGFEGFHNLIDSECLDKANLFSLSALVKRNL